ncbi:cold shock domain-containing protein E1-like [Pollicipes pollicipes]|uniref:cold shock domain-containing protein E1-like n=1 Tax=Pollicipes pollicipes TaxID=41117 RepID=UPI0018851A14|nr:cold shock domain-containing protein E1-like [Pollicipes pollicipes]
MSSVPPPVYLGYVIGMKSTYGFIETRDYRSVDFDRSKLAGGGENVPLCRGDEVEFTLEKPGRAAHVTKLPAGTIARPALRSEKPRRGVVTQQILSATDVADISGRLEDKAKRTEHRFGVSAVSNTWGKLVVGEEVMYKLEKNNERAANITVERSRSRSTVSSINYSKGFGYLELGNGTLFFFSEVKDDQQLAEGDEVECSLVEVTTKNGNRSEAVQILPVNVRRNRFVLERATLRGYVCSVAGEFGFIETMNHRSTSFHLACTEGIPPQRGDEVEYTQSQRGVVERVTKLPAGTIARPTLLPGMHRGVVLHPVSRDRYTIDISGSLKDSDTGAIYKFGVYSASNTCGLLGVGEEVTFQLEGNTERAANITVDRARLRSTVKHLVPNKRYGFLEHEGGTLFHFSEVQNGQKLAVGDEVEFSLTHASDHRDEQPVAVQVVRVGDGSRPAPSGGASGPATSGPPPQPSLD